MSIDIDPSLPVTFSIYVTIGDDHGNDRHLFVSVAYYPEATGGLVNELSVLSVDDESWNPINWDDDEEQLIREAIKDGGLISSYER